MVAALLVGLSAAVYPPKELLGSSEGSSSAVSLTSSASVILADAFCLGVFLALLNVTDQLVVIMCSTAITWGEIWAFAGAFRWGRIEAPLTSVGYCVHDESSSFRRWQPDEISARLRRVFPAGVGVDDALTWRCLALIILGLHFGWPCILAR